MLESAQRSTRSRLIPLPCPPSMALYQSIKHNSLPFLQAAGIQPGSKEHKELRTTIQTLRHQHLDPLKYVEEQSPGRVDRLVDNAQARLPWLLKYESCWPARVYLKRYVDSSRRRFARTKCRQHQRPLKARKSKLQPPNNACIAKNDHNHVLDDHDPIVMEFLGSLAPSLEYRLNAFAQLGVKDQRTLEAFLSWPQETREQFLDDGREVLQLTALEKRGLLLGCALFGQEALRRSLAKSG